jgi:hypothetical protein
MKKYRFFALLAICGGSLFAQSEADLILSQTQNMPSDAAGFGHFELPMKSAATPAVPPIQNIFTVIGPNDGGGSVPCYSCVSGATGSNIGIVQPAGTIHADGVNLNWAVNNYMVDNSYAGVCNYTFLVQDAAKKYIAKVTAAFTHSSNSTSLTSTAFTIPHSAAVAGEGKVLTVLQCGPTKAVSSSTVYIAFP